ncbi:DUF956 family protein [Agrilactobacillus fermenti]|uniref:DUF956 family protein n=1 Tax=Agrilactobacillus fermenti TaxID=2586909 RepID=UPI001E609BD5|nr:DUF956 family protein [Agrilactobacillus fermenti]MCD2255976.1 DUF956 family protein [Agrilactobacillus fermenti]
MVQSINTKVDLVTNATSYLGLTDYGKIMIGDRGFEFFNDRSARNNIQIPWTEVDYVVASIMFKGKWIPRYAIQTKRNGTYSFASKDPKKVLRTIRKYIPADHIVRSLGFFDVIKRGLHIHGKNG